MLNPWRENSKKRLILTHISSKNSFIWIMLILLFHNVYQRADALIWYPYTLLGVTHSIQFLHEL